MSAQIINLRQVRKARARSEHDAEAQENRVRHGMTKEERAKAKAARERAEKRLDNLKRGEAYEPADDDLDPGNVS